MRIALFVHCFFPDHVYGTEAYTLALAKQLRARGHAVTVVAGHFQGAPRRTQFATEYVHDGIPVISLDKNHLPHATIRGTYYQREMRAPLERILRKLAPDAIHVTHLLNHTAALLEVAGAMGIPATGTLTDFFGICLNNRMENAQGALCAGPDATRENCMACHIKAAQPQSFAAPALRALITHEAQAEAAEKLAAQLQDGIIDQSFGFDPRDIAHRPGFLMEAYSAYRALIAPTRFLHDAYLRNGLTAPLTLSRFGIDIDRTPKPPRPDGAPLRLGYIGQIAPHKGVHVLVEALRALPRGAATLQIYGPVTQDPLYVERLRRRIDGLDAEFLGTVPREDLAAAQRGLDLLVIPSTWPENAPLILLQALATHTPVIVSDMPGLTEFVEDGINGFAFPANDPAALARILRRFIDTSDLARRMSLTTHYAREEAAMADDIIALWDAPPSAAEAAYA